MAKSQVERYEQLLAADPSSTVFVELAKALVAKGDCSRAVEVCRRGVEHHPRSVAGRVLWGKALILLNRPAEAMEQFDQAMALDRENPYAYNLISEVLLKRGLYRSALPILRKAAALQPDDGRVRAWLEQTQAALAGGPAPALPDERSDDEPAPEEPAPSLAADAAPAGGLRPQAHLLDDRTVAGLEIPAELRAQMVPPEEERARELAAPARAARAGGGRGARQGAPAERLPPPVLVAVDAPAAPDVDEPPAAGEATQVMLTGDLLRVMEAARQEEAQARGGGGLLGELPPPEDPQASSASLRTPAATPVSRGGSGGQARRGGGLLADLPDATLEATVSAAPVAPGSADTAEVAEVAARAYEQELKARLGAEAKAWGRPARYLPAVAVGAVALVAVAVFAFSFVRTRKDFGGRDLKGALVEARRQVAEDTPASLRAALSTLGAAVEMDASNAEAWALTALAQALSAAEHGGGPEARAAARAALAHEGVEAASPGTRTVVDWLLAGRPARAAAEVAVLQSEVEDAHVHALAGRLLLARGEAKEALARFQRALRADPSHARALLSLADYYRREGDLPQALAMYERVGAAHPERVLGVAEVRLQQEQELDAALQDVQALPPAALEGAPALQVRHRLVLGRLLSGVGKHREALAALAEASAGLARLTPGAEAGQGVPRPVDVQLALSEARRAAGELPGAQAAAEAALKLEPRSEAALEALGRALLGRDREQDVLGRLPAEPGARRVALVRGLARARLGEWKAARAELSRTEVDGRYPSEAVVALALADAAEGAPERAQAVLEKVLLATRRARADVRVALGRVYWQRGALDKARSQFEEALGEPDGVAEGGCALGRLYLAQGAPEQAVAPLQRAVAANGYHGEAREALGQALLGLGRSQEALKQFEAWELETPGAARAHRGHAHALFLLGKLAEAEGAAGRAVKLDPADAAAHRLQAVILAARGQAEGAFVALQQANRLDPKDPDTFCEIGLTFLRKGQAENAARAFGAALRENPRSACGRAGRLLAEPPDRRDAAAAVRELTRLVQEAPYVWDKAVAGAALAGAQLARGEVKAARAAAEQAVARMPVSAVAQLALGQAALRARDEALALEALGRASALDPSNAPLQLALADALARSEAQLPRALEAYEAFLRLEGPADEQARVRKLLPTLRKRLEAR